jgi:tRNA(fMet)-specific endonuclease VapC
MRYLLDTNACIAVMRNDAKVLQHLSSVAPGDCAVSTITSYELYTGVEKCARPAAERVKVDLLLTTVQQVEFGARGAQEAAHIRAALEAQGQTIGPYDLLLAGHALSLGLILVSANTKEFSRVSGLVVENWQS